MVGPQEEGARGRPKNDQVIQKKVFNISNRERRWRAC